MAFRLIDLIRAHGRPRGEDHAGPGPETLANWARANLLFMQEHYIETFPVDRAWMQFILEIAERTT